TMIALGLARPTRWTSWGREFSRREEAKARILSRCPNPALAIARTRCRDTAAAWWARPHHGHRDFTREGYPHALALEIRDRAGHRPGGQAADAGQGPRRLHHHRPDRYRLS